MTLFNTITKEDTKEEPKKEGGQAHSKGKCKNEGAKDWHDKRKKWDIICNC